MDWDWRERDGTKSMVMDTPRGFSIEARAVHVTDDTGATIEVFPKAQTHREARQGVPGGFPEDLWVDVNSAARFVEIPTSLHNTAITTLIAPHLVSAKRPWKRTAEGWMLKVEDPAIEASDTPQTIHIKNIWVWANARGSGVSVGDYEAVWGD